MVYAEVDMSNQIMNSWNKPTALAMVQQNLKCAILIDVPNKILIKKECEKNLDFTSVALPPKKIKNLTKNYNCRVSALVHSYLLHKLIILNKDVLQKVEVCRDNPSKYINQYYQLISNNQKSWDYIRHIKVSYGLKKKNNSAQSFAKEVAKGDTKPTYLLNRNDTQAIIDLINKFVQKPRRF